MGLQFKKKIFFREKPKNDEFWGDCLNPKNGPLPKWAWLKFPNVIIGPVPSAKEKPYREDDHVEWSCLIFDLRPQIFVVTIFTFFV